MKYILAAALTVIAFACQSASAADAIALTVKYAVSPDSGAEVGELKLSQQVIFDIAKTALERKGWKVVRFPKDARGGVEALIDVYAVQNVASGGAIGFAVSLGLFGVSNGTSDISDGKRVAFEYSSGLVSYGGTQGYPVQSTSSLQKTRRGVAEEITKWIASVF